MGVTVVRPGYEFTTSSFPVRKLAGLDVDCSVHTVGRLRTAGGYALREHGANLVTLHFVHRGRMAFTIGSSRRILREGEALAAWPGTTFDQDDGGAATELTWCSLQGTEVDAALAEVGITPERPHRDGVDVAACEPLFREALAGGMGRLDPPYYGTLLGWRLLATMAGGSDDDDPVARYLAAVRRDPAHPVPVRAFAAAEGCARATLHRRFVAECGCAPKEWELAERLARARRMLAGGGVPVADVARECGFADPDYFSRAFGRRYGVAPTAHLRAGG